MDVTGSATSIVFLHDGTKDEGATDAAMVDDARLQRWFCEEVLPLEASLTRYLHRNWRRADDVIDLRQDIYEAALNGARHGLPDHAAGYVFAIARNLMINRAKRARIVSFEQIVDLEEIDHSPDLTATERHLDARNALRRAQAGMEALPPRCREVVRLRKIEGLTTREAAERMGVTIATIERQLVLGIRAMADAMLGGSGQIRRGGTAATKRENRQ